MGGLVAATEQTDGTRTGNGTELRTTAECGLPSAGFGYCRKLVLLRIPTRSHFYAISIFYYRHKTDRVSGETRYIVTIISDKIIYFVIFVYNFNFITFFCFINILDITMISDNTSDPIVILVNPFFIHILFFYVDQLPWNKNILIWPT